MLYSITVDHSGPPADNEALLEALDIIHAKPLLRLQKRRQWLASTPYHPFAVRRLLDRCARGDDKIEIVVLPKQRAEGLRELLDHSGRAQG